MDEFIKAGFTKRPSDIVTPPGVAESPFIMECKLLHQYDTGGKPGAGNLLVGTTTNIGATGGRTTHNHTGSSTWTSSVSTGSSAGSNGGTNNAGAAHNSADPEGDGIGNLIEYALGGFPNLGNEQGILPRIGKLPEESFQGLEYIYRRRRDAAARGLTYTVEASTNLPSSVWSTGGVTETGTGIVDGDFVSVTNRISFENSPAGFIRLKVGLEE